MRKLQLILCFWVLLGPFGFLSMPGARAQTTVPPGVTFVTPGLNWSQSPSTSLTAGVEGHVTLTPCPNGIDTTSGAGYMVVILDSTNGSESVSVIPTTGDCTSGASSGTIHFIPFYPHTGGQYTIGSASTGIQETLNVACGTSAVGNVNPYYQNSQCHVIIPANGPCKGQCNGNGTGNSAIYNNYNVYGTIYLHSNQILLDGSGVFLYCNPYVPPSGIGTATTMTLRGPCLQAGYVGVPATNFNANVVRGLSFRAPSNVSSIPAFAGLAITNTQCSSGSEIITTSSAHGFRVGDLVTVLFTDDSQYWGDAPITAVTSNTFTATKNCNTANSVASPGVVALAYDAILDGAQGTHWENIQYDFESDAGAFNNFFDFWDDENATIDHFNNNGHSLNGNANWTGSFIFSGGNPGSGQWAPVITVRDSSITANGSSCVTDYNSNGLYIENTVCQAQGLWEVHSSNTTGNYQGAYLKNIYSEIGPNLNPYWGVSGSVTSGTFSIYEQVKQSSTLAVAYLENAVTGTIQMQLGALTGTPDSSHTWVGQTSGAVYTPTSLPTASTPFPGLGFGGLIAGPSSGSFRINGSGTVGAFATGGTGSQNCTSNPYCYTYYIVANDSNGAQTSPMQVLNWFSTGSDSIPVQWPRVANGGDGITYDVIRQTTPVLGPTGVVPAPYSGGCNGGSGMSRGNCGYVVKGLTQSAACGATPSLICSYLDSGSGSTTGYTINQGTYVGPLNFWPAALVAVGAPAVVVDYEEYPAVGVSLYGNPIQTATWCTGDGVASSGAYTTCLASSTTINNAIKNQTATILTDGPEVVTGMNLTKGRLNFSSTPGAYISAHHIITLIDSQPGLTQATWGYRPPASQNDTWIGTDTQSPNLASGTLAFGSPMSITNYIAQLGNGANWGERLTSAAKLFTVPIYGVNSPALTSATTITGTSLTSTGIVLPAVPTSTTVHGRCSLIWEQTFSSGSPYVQFGVGMNNAPTSLWVAPPTIWNGAAVAFGPYALIATTTPTNITSNITPAATATGYKLEFDFTLETSTTNPVTLTVYGLTSNASDALVVEPGSACGWQP
jgi:hypothetical protein